MFLSSTTTLHYKAFLYHIEKLGLLKFHFFLWKLEIPEIKCAVKLLYLNKKGTFTKIGRFVTLVTLDIVPTSRSLRNKDSFVAHHMLIRSRDCVCAPGSICQCHSGSHGITVSVSISVSQLVSLIGICICEAYTLTLYLSHFPHLCLACVLSA